MKIAIVGSGISGVYAAHYLSQKHQVTLYEANAYLGGHTDTQHLMLNNQSYAVDTGFIVFNEHHYRFFCDFIKQLGVASQATDMTFSVSDSISGLEYNATTVDKLFCQRRNLLRPRFYRMVWDILRFYKEAPALLQSEDNQQTIGEYLTQNNYSQTFIDDHILPMACALWSGPAHVLQQFPVRYLVAFLDNHQMLQVDRRPEWRTIEGGSDTYLKAFEQQFNGEILLNTPVEIINRSEHGVSICTAKDHKIYDQLILACHSDQALALLADPSTDETDVLGAIAYQDNEVALHTDSNLMPKHPKAWASWNALKLDQEQHHCTVSYYMNLLQNISCPEPLIVSLNCTDKIDPEKILVKRHYHHPVYTPETLVAQKRHADINGQNRTYYAGAYWGWGFHEDGAKSARIVVESLLARHD
ncbi:MAG: FAD-dependent oxidoreductase [Gammaproteobacteria bacterium]|nr:FAD-dependent oxidoreductase [Gammaproteobacteria bacterium]MBT5221670.1 FAD-dependent oxidoreductase [Gammaproteobacteria bacterium]MBT5826011.1 FAD-dependent oxidoreductase [Gammaproteobacteria bacterium]MBT6420976.1 FAD-dependent oxidoreductase [Gammaproteobacteria bacterium]MBT6576240.1 FAD-dependent oxidoreductase [Gammaproteobacteria bacterium]